MVGGLHTVLAFFLPTGKIYFKVSFVCSIWFQVPIVFEKKKNMRLGCVSMKWNLVSKWSWDRFISSVNLRLDL